MKLSSTAVAPLDPSKKLRQIRIATGLKTGATALVESMNSKKVRRDFSDGEWSGLETATMILCTNASATWLVSPKKIV